jgi:hypothetical protein
MSISTVMHGYATGLDDAKTKVRAAFDKWLVWGQGLSDDDPERKRVTEELAKMGG